MQAVLQWKGCRSHYNHIVNEIVRVSNAQINPYLTRWLRLSRCIGLTDYLERVHQILGKIENCESEFEQRP